MNYKKREMKIVEQFAIFLKDKYNIGDALQIFTNWKESIITEFWEIVSFQIGNFKVVDGISRDMESNKYIKWDIIYKHPENGFRISRGAGFVTFQNYDYNKMLERPETYKIWQVKINDILYNIGDIYPKFVLPDSYNQRIKSFFIQSGNLYIETTTNGKILIK